MRNLFAFIAALAVCACAGQKEADIRLSFNVTDPVGSEIVLVYHTSMVTAALDEAGCGETVIDGVDAAYVSICYGQKVKQIYVEKGDRVVISFNGRDFDRSFSVEGDKKAASDYLNTISLPTFPDEVYALPFDGFISRLSSMEADAVKLLEASGVEDDGDFEYREKGRIRYSYATPLLMYPLGHSMMTGNMDFVPSSEYYDLLRKYFVEDEKLVNVARYRDFIVEAAHVLDPASADVKGMYARTVAQMKFIAGSFRSPKVMQSLLHYLAAPYVEQFGIDNIDELQNVYRTYVKDPVLLADFQKKYDKWDVARAGAVSPDFSAEDLSGKRWSLEDFRGKYVYLDIWATWCGPCRRELPYLKQLEEDFKDSNIAFVGLSVDQDKDRWVGMAADMPGVQLYLGQDSPFTEAYGIRSIPRFILLGKDGRIISSDMSRPSSADTRTALESLEGIR